MYIEIFEYTNISWGILPIRFRSLPKQKQPLHFLQEISEDFIKRVTDLMEKVGKLFEIVR